LVIFYLKNETDSNFDSLISVGIGLYAFANLITFAPELHGRTKIIAGTFILAAAIHFQLGLKEYLLSQKTKKIINRFFGLFLISAIPIFLLQISELMQNMSFFIFLLPQISWLLGDEDYSIRMIIGLFINK
jgi:hypothetical protein